MAALESSPRNARDNVAARCILLAAIVTGGVVVYKRLSSGVGSVLACYGIYLHTRGRAVNNNYVLTTLLLVGVVD